MKKERYCEQEVSIFLFDTSGNNSLTCRISSLNHEAFNISVEDGAVVESTGTQSQKVLWNNNNNHTQNYLI